MKRKLSFLIAAIMVLSMLPAMGVSAATSNAVVRTGGTVSDDQDWGVTLTEDTPMFRIKTDGDNQAYKVGKIAGVTLNNAEWSWEGDDATPGDFFETSAKAGYADYSGDTLYVDAATGTDVKILKQSLGDTIVSAVSYEMRFITSDYAEIFLTQAGVDLIHGGGDKELVFPLPVRMKGEGAAQVTISNLNSSPVTEQTYTFANGASGSTNVTVSDPNKSTSNVLNISTMTITETGPNTIDLNGDIELTAPAGFKWKSNVDATVTGIRGFDGSGTGWSPLFEIEDDTTLLIHLDETTIVPTGNSVGALQIKGLKLERTGKIKETPAGDMRVRVRVPGGGTETLVVGKFSESNITLEVQDKELPQVISGKYLQHYDDETTKTLDFTITENSSNIWNTGVGGAEFEINDGVKFRALEVVDYSGINNGSKDLAYLVSEDQGTSSEKVGSLLTLADDSFTLSPSRKGTDNIEIKLRAYVTVKPGYTGDIAISTDEDNEAFSSTLHGVVAKAIDPFTVTTKTTDVHLGVMNIALGDINIKENAAGALTRTGAAARNVYSKGPDGYEFYIGGASNYARFRDGGKAEVVSGDIVIDDLALISGSGADSNRYFEGGILNLTIKNESTKASEIKLSGMTMDADRNIPAGKLELRVGGLATANYHDNDNKDFGSFGVSYFVASADYVNIVTAPTDVDNKYTTEVSVVVGQKTIKANGVEYTLDVAPFIQDGYTMVPVRAVAVAMGIEDSKIHWDANNKTVTILDTNRGRSSQFKQGTSYVITNNMQVGFDGPSCMNVESRVFLPFRALGEIVLGCPVTWDSATQTAYFNQVAVAGTTVAQ